MARPGKAVAKRASKTPAKTTARTSVARVKKIKLYAPPQVPSIQRGDEFYKVDSDGILEIPAEHEADFLTMGCTREKQEPAAVINHVDPQQRGEE